MPHWNDDQCLSFYEQEERMEKDIETCQVWYAYYKWNEVNGRRFYGVLPEEVFNKKNLSYSAYDFEKFHSKSQAESQIEQWRESFRR